MKKILPFLILTFVGLGLFVFILVKIGAKNILLTLSILSPSTAFIGLAVFFIIVILSVIRWQIILRSLGYKVGIWKLFMAKTSGFAISYLTPMSFFGGEPWRAYFLRKEKNIALHQGLSSIFIEKTMDLLAGAFLVFLAFFYLIIKPVSAQIIVISILLIAGIVAGLFFFFNCLKNEKRFFFIVAKFLGLTKIKYVEEKSDRIRRMENNLFNFFNKDRYTLLMSFLILGLEIFLSLILSKIILISLGSDLSFFQLVLVRSLTLLVSIIPVPAALGVSEGGQAFAFIILGLGATLGVVFSLLIRCFYLLEVVVGLIFLSHFGIKLTQAMFFKVFANGNQDNNLDIISKLIGK